MTRPPHKAQVSKTKFSKTLFETQAAYSFQDQCLHSGPIQELEALNNKKQELKLNSYRLTNYF